MRLRLAISPSPARRCLTSGVLALLSCSALFAQQTPVSSTVDGQTLQILLKRIDQLEARVSELEAEQKKAQAGRQADAVKPVSSLMSGAADPPHSLTAPRSISQIPAAVQAPPVVPSESEQTQIESATMERMDLSKTLLRIRGFGDASFHGDTFHGDTTSFSLGQLDLFVTSDISDKSRFIGEIVFEAGPDNIYGTASGPENTFGVDIERYLLQYFHNDYLNFSLGRGHTAIGYYNTAYHHSTWLQTTVDRPYLFEFEDRGGILPIHIVGLTANGIVPSGSLGLHYVAEIGNGRESRSPLENEPVQNEISDSNHKAFNLAVFARPDGLRGFQTGFSVYHDLLAPADAPKIGETILAAHAILIHPKFEWLTEALVDRHAPVGSSAVFHTPGFYSQISKQFGAYRPYLRYEYINAPDHEPVFPDVALRHGPLLGIRYDANESVALKFQYNYTFLRNQTGVNGLTAQVGFTF
jgi:hypothetical protein